MAVAKTADGPDVPAALGLAAAAFLTEARRRLRECPNLAAPWLRRIETNA